jgi:hypothetical protein
MPVIPSDFIGSDPGKIAIHFNNGSGIVKGSIVKQVGSRRYTVSDGNATYTVNLVTTMQALEPLLPGYATIKIYPFVNGKTVEQPEHIHRLEQFSCYTIEGHQYAWKLSGGHDPANQDGEGTIAQL